jgi:hypothetical protein
MTCQEIQAKVDAIYQYVITQGQETVNLANNATAAVNGDNIPRARELVSLANNRLSDLDRRRDQLVDLQAEANLAGCSFANFVSQVLSQANQLASNARSAIARANIAIKQLEDTRRQQQVQTQAAANAAPTTARATGNAATPPTQQAGSQVLNQQSARADKANTQLPEPSPLKEKDGKSQPQSSTPPTNAETRQGTPDAGLNDASRKLTTTQSVPSPTASTPAGQAANIPAAGVGNAVAAVTPGVGASNDDAVPVANAAQSTQSVTATQTVIEPRPNVLDRLASVAYSVSIYMMTKEDYNRLLTSKQKYIPGKNLLIQSGGAAVGDRNQFFPLDYTIDDVVIECLAPGKGTGMPHNAVKLSFTITESNGITLLDNLYQAVQNFNQGRQLVDTDQPQGLVVDPTLGQSSGSNNQNYASQNYLMVIRFYGYDAEGNLVTNPGVGSVAGSPGNRAIVEKYIPFQFTNISFKVGSKLVEYNCEAVCPQNVVNTSQGRGVIPYNIELVSTTLQKLFNGNDAYGQAPAQAPGRDTAPGATAPDSAAAAPSPTLVKGLTQTLNDFQRLQVQQGKQKIADVYKIELATADLANAKTVPPGQLDRSGVATNTVPTTAGQALDPAAQKVATDQKPSSVTAGTTLIQFIDQAVRNSDYITKQQKTIIDSDGKEKPQTPANKDGVKWYKINLQSKQLEYDEIRKDYAYEMTYQVAPYTVYDLKSEYFPEGKFRGSHKQYFYWFTGQNTSVINFEQDFNYLYFLTISGKAGNLPVTSNFRELEKRYTQTNSPESNKGAQGNQFEPAANAADYLYSPSDQSRITITIIGDPAWIMQGEVWSGVGPPGSNRAANGFLDDGTIDFDSGEAVFLLGWNKPQDYNVQTGLIDLSRAASQEPVQLYAYKTVSITNKFQQGKFTQDLTGVLLTFPVDRVGNVANAASSETQRATTLPPPNRVSSVAGNVTITPSAVPYVFTSLSGGQAVGPVSLPQGLALDNIGIQNVLPQPPARPPTSSGIDVGPGTPQISLRPTGSATGPAVGIPSVQVTLTSGQSRTVFTQAEIQSLLSQGLITQPTANTATRQLAQLENAAGSLTTNRPSFLGAWDE